MAGPDELKWRPSDPDYDTLDVCGRFEYEYYLEDDAASLHDRAVKARRRGTLFPEIREQLAEASARLEQANAAASAGELDVAIARLASFRGHCRRAGELAEDKRVSMARIGEREEGTGSEGSLREGFGDPPAPLSIDPR
jgi:hypothetical protein